MSDPRLAPFGIIPIIAGDAPCPCCDGEHGNRQFQTWCVTGGEIGEQALSSRGGRVDGVVRGEDNDPGPALVACRDVTEDGGAAKAVGQEWSERTEEADLRGFKTGSPGFTCQGEGAPGPRRV